MVGLLVLQVGIATRGGGTEDAGWYRLGQLLIAASCSECRVPLPGLAEAALRSPQTPLSILAPAVRLINVPSLFNTPLGGDS